MASKSLTLVPVGGLGNRIFAIVSAIAYCAERNYPLRILWFRDWGMGARFHDLFELNEELRKVSVLDAKWYHSFLFDKPRRKNLWIPRLFQSVFFDKRIYEEQLYQLDKPEDIVSELDEAKGHVYLIHLAKFYVKENLFEAFRPVKSLRDAIAMRTRDFSTYTVGMHVRRTDNTRAIQSSPLSWFIQQAEREIALHPDVKFYVATDSNKDKQSLKAILGNRMLTSWNEVRRDTQDGIKDAVIELYTLSKTQKIYGSAYSSYSILASELSNIPLFLS